MLLSDVSVKRPVFATVVNVLLIIFGIVAFTMLPLREFPDIDAPVVTISTDYPGASAEVVETQVTQLIEERISGIEGIKNISSRSRPGNSSISIEFTLSRDIDAASNDVRERVSRALDNLPEESDPPEVSKASSDETTVVWYNLRSESMSILELTDYAERYIVDRLAVVDGVARVRIGGDRRYAMRVWLDRDAMAARQITVTDIVSRLREENIELPAGEVESTEREFSVRMARAYLSEDDFRNLVIRQGDDGYLVRLGEVARVELGAEDDKTDFRGNGVNMVGIGIIKQSKANTLSVVENVREEMEVLEKTLPETMYLATSYDSSIFIKGSIDEVYNTLLIAMALVVVVIYLFLGNIRATIIPALTVPVAIIASYIVLFSLGFSINLLTLLALVLAIGLVVDDSIVVLENIYRRVEEGEPPLLAAYRGAREVGFAVIATTLVLISVFVPLAFLEGNIGKLFTEFALAIAAAVAFSSIAALTLTPMLGSKILHKKERTSKFGMAFDRFFKWLEAKYTTLLEGSIKRPSLALVLVVLSGVVSYGAMQFVPQEFAPPEDRGTFYISIKGAEGASFESNSRHMDEIEQILLPYIDQNKIDRVIVRAPGWGNSAGIAIVGAIPFEERDWSTFELMEEMRKKLNQVVGVQAFAFMRSGISGGGGRPVQFVLQGNTYEKLAEYRDIVIEEAAKNPGLVEVDSDYKETLPQLLIEVDEVRAADLGVSVEDIGITLQSILGQRRVTTYLDRGEEYYVMLEGEKADYRSPSAIDNIYVRSGKSGELIPLSNVVKVSERATSSQLNRYNRMRSVTIEANLAEGYSLGEALSYLESVVDEKLPEDVSIDYKGESQLYKESGSSIVFVFGLALIITFLVLAAQFESFIHPLVIMLAVPIAIVGAFIGLYLTGNSINIYSQIGIVMLIGLAAKNGILIVEFANQLRDAGLSFRDAVITASRQRLRPIVMTAFTTLMSSVPLILGTGPGSESRMVIGTVIFAGVALSAFLTLFVIPALYMLMAQKTQSPMAITRRLESLQEEYPDHRH
ncbi:efflux RND transporter permease subunit [Idiomarina sp. UBA3162]|jgi:multidrug efflux pump|uniref:efflux RND transporter permease subunit n=1 Tax=unclassified Idiomarina TaxID=2614829 RepID=UPI000C89F774|nr:efflux RND transporter permease subunit [Idiomarina sp. UBA3162]MAD53388.1 multidrug transporter AcrB [Idiomarinaceae bacterium]|tara:strand:- start:3384 stop:6482 length:3099 start_codon:yes stop_codon:yes gene_type:complete